MTVSFKIVGILINPSLLNKPKKPKKKLFCAFELHNPKKPTRNKMK